MASSSGQRGKTAVTRFLSAMLKIPQSP